MVFATNADHSRFHQSGVAIKQGDVYISPKNPKTCIDCGKELKNNSKRCFDCWNIYQRKVKRSSKDELIELIKTESLESIGRKYGVTGNAVKKWCKSYEIPHKRKDL